MKIRVFADVKVHIRTKDILRENVVYCLTFPDGKKYIGATTQKLIERVRAHSRHSFYKNTGEYKTKKSKAVREFMEFGVEVLYQAETAEDLQKAEMEYINKFNTTFDGYNGFPGGSVGRKMSEEQKQKISEANKGKISHNRIPVMKYTLDGEFIEEFESMAAAAKSVTDNPKGSSGISSYIKGRVKTAYGFHWKLKK